MKRTLIILFVLVLFTMTALAAPKHRRANAPPAAESSGQGAADNKICKNSLKAPGNGTQNPQGQCSNTVQGEIPDVNHMVATLIIEPAASSVIKADKSFQVTLVNTGLNTGNFDLAKSQYYIFPQKLDANGNIFGHQHVTVQKIDSFSTPPDPKVIAFFKGLNDPANNKNQLSVTVPPLKQPGLYRICSMTGTFSHQPVLMPVAQRGAQDDCIRIQVKK